MGDGNCTHSKSAYMKLGTCIVWAVKKFMFLYGVHFTLQPDHQPLSFLKKTKFSNNRIGYVSAELSDPNRGHKWQGNVDADYLSRRLG